MSEMDKGNEARKWIGTVFLPAAILAATMIHQRSGEKQLEQRHRDEVALKFIELSWDAIQNHDSVRTREALRVLAVFDPVMAKQLALVALDHKADYESVIPAQLDSVDYAIVRAGLIGVRISVTANGDGGRTFPLAVSKYIGHLQGGDPLPIRWVKHSSRHIPQWSAIHYPTGLKQEALALQRLLESRYPQLAFSMVEAGGDARSLGILVYP
jgi:hypothetical protein